MGLYSLSKADAIANPLKLLGSCLSPFYRRGSESLTSIEMEIHDDMDIIIDHMINSCGVYSINLVPHPTTIL